jgi:hypothetical protein
VCTDTAAFIGHIKIQLLAAGEGWKSRQTLQCVCVVISNQASRLYLSVLRPLVLLIAAKAFGATG